MKFPAFDYFVPETLPEAVEALAGDEDAKVLAGGQSLLPLMALRLARPTLLIDLSHLRLDSVSVSAERVLSIGSMTRQCELLTNPDIAVAAPLIAAAAAHVGHVATRNRGTLGGSLAHADPVAELPAVTVALGGEVILVGPEGPRVIPCADLAESYFTTTIDPGEIIVEVRVPAAGPGHGAAWCEWAPCAGDFAEVGVGVAIDVDSSGECRGVRAAACGVSSIPVDLGPVLSAAVVGAPAAGPDLLRHVAIEVEGLTTGAGDKAEMAGLLAARALVRAFAAVSLAGARV